MISKQEKEKETIQQIKNRKGNFFPGTGISHEVMNISAEKALKSTIEADYRQLAKIIDADPELMFVETTASDINGQNITTSPLRYALEKLDTLAWKYFESVCLRFPEHMDAFIATVCSVVGVPDLTPLYNAYEYYIDLGEKYSEAHWEKRHTLQLADLPGGDELESLIKSWLSLGLQQRHCLPRHMLRDLCHCSMRDLIYNDVVLMRIVNFKRDSQKEGFLERCKHIMISHDDCPLILLSDGLYQVLYLGLDNNVIVFNDGEGNECGAFSERDFPFIKLEFPETAFTPVKKRAERNDDNLKKDEYGRPLCDSRRMWKSKKDLSFSLNCQALYADINFSKKQSEIKYLFPLLEKSGLGYNFALARGCNDICLGMDDPRGNMTLLFAKAKEDYEGIQQLAELRFQERNELIKTYSPSSTPKPF